MAKLSDIQYPDGRDFIFTIYDDTDVATAESIKPVYDYLTELNIKTTKTVWPLSTTIANSYHGSDTLQNASYLNYLVELQQRGFEISFHGATMVSSKREDTLSALEIFKEKFGEYPRTYAAHSFNRDNLYWGKDRFDSYLFKKLYKVLSRESTDFYQGHTKGSKYFWGDIAKEYIPYSRSFTFDKLNLLDMNLPILYEPKKKEYLNYCFITADADNVEEFNHLFSEKNQNSLINNRGICIISTHFGKGFVSKGKLNNETQRLLKNISHKNGWFVPVDKVLDFLNGQPKSKGINSSAIKKMEMKWFIHSFIRKFKSKDYNPTEIEYLNKTGESSN